MYTQASRRRRTTPGFGRSSFRTFVSVHGSYTTYTTMQSHPIHTVRLTAAAALQSMNHILHTLLQYNHFHPHGPVSGDSCSPFLNLSYGVLIVPADCSYNPILQYTPIQQSNTTIQYNQHWQVSGSSCSRRWTAGCENSTNPGELRRETLLDQRSASGSERRFWIRETLLDHAQQPRQQAEKDTR